MQIQEHPNLPSIFSHTFAQVPRLNMHPNFKNYLLDATQAYDCIELEVIQSLWSGYGKISRYQLIDAPFDTVVVKCIALEAVQGHPRGWNTNRSHNRKVKSYQVETFWYEKWSQHCTAACRVPAFLGSFSEGKNQWIILEDLNVQFPLRKYELELPEVKACLTWLAHFHATFLGKKPTGLWEVGTYWHLATRPDEFDKINHIKLKNNAHIIDSQLNKCNFQTIVHGDAKLANFCFSKDGTAIAAVDFQYVGGGCGMKDVAYFLGSCLSCAECSFYEKELLNFYFSELKNALAGRAFEIDFSAIERAWRRLYPFACADFTRFLLGWMPTHGKVNDYNLRILDKVLSDL